MTRFMPGDRVLYRGASSPHTRLGTVLEVNDEATSWRGGRNWKRSRTVTKLLVEWEDGYFTRPRTWVGAYWCQLVDANPVVSHPDPDPVWAIPEVASVVRAFDQTDWSKRPAWPPLADAIDALREPVLPDALRAEDI